IAFESDRGNRSKAVERRVEELRERVEELRERIEELKKKKMELRKAYRSGELSKTEFQARMASLSTKVDETKQSVSKVLNKTTGLDRAALNGVNVTAIRML
ncbi:MAG: CdvA-like protein, partial [Halobacteria archaeon]|nr:CdvA-like protein [Halobacteria archaeon]